MTTTAIQQPIQRIPRPLGITKKAQALSLDPTNKNLKQNLTKAIVHHYVSNNFTYITEAMSINQLSLRTNIPSTLLLSALLQRASQIGSLLDPSRLEGQLRGLNATLLEWALTDRSLIAQQAATLLASQGGQYKAFVTGEVNRALKLMLESQKGLSDAIIGIGGKQGTSINILNQNQGPTTENHITVEKALTLIKDEGHGQALPTHEEAQMLYEKHADGAEPIINARAQGDTATDGPNLKVIKGMQLSQKQRDQDARKGRRRTKEEGLDPETL